MPNRVKELESAVAQLQATVDGLREELVDANERIRLLERELADEPATSTEPTDEEPAPVAFPVDESENEEETAATATDDADRETESLEDIIVA